MEAAPIFLIQILQILADRYGMTCTLEELTSLLTAVFDSTIPLKESISNDKENQAKVLDALILLNKDGYLFLNSISDESTISIKGLILVNSKVLQN